MPEPPLFPIEIIIVDYDSRWPLLYLQERDLLLHTTNDALTAIEHIGSTAIPEQRAKPIIDLMAAVLSLENSQPLIDLLGNIGYHLTETGMRNRLFFRKRDNASEHVYHLHIVEEDTWADRKERLMRDYLLTHPELVIAYGELKSQLAQEYPRDSLSYTRAKTDFIQNVIDRARAERGIPRIPVWEE